MATPILVDGRNLFSLEEATAAGFDYTGVGRCPRPRPAVARPMRRDGELAGGSVVPRTTR